jgi:tetratricopeptide (TPR) repeat protein
MESFARSRPARSGVAALAIAVLGFYVYTVLIIWRADWLQDGRDQRSLQASEKLQPWDAQTHWLRGRYLLHADQDPEGAVVTLHRAVELDPYEGRYWLDLAGAYYQRGNPVESKAALEHALRMEPTSLVIAWDAANLYLAQNDVSSALPLFRVALEYDPGKSDDALDLCWRATKSIGLIVARALPPQAAAYFALLKLLVNEKQMAPANELWHALIAEKLKFPVPEAFPYFDYLIQTQQIDQARQVWADLRTSHSELADDSPTNLVRNGGFEAEFLNGGLDWRKDQSGEVEISRDSTEFHRGSRALQIAFRGPGPADVGFCQYVPVQPNTGYRLSAFVKTQEIDTASGPRLAVEDSPSGTILANTDEFLDTSDWRQHTIEFATGPETHLVMLRIVRIPGGRLIKGTFWLDDIELVPTAATAAPSAAQ